jgi:AbiV family abortive infection protein
VVVWVAGCAAAGTLGALLLKFPDVLVHSFKGEKIGFPRVSAEELSLLQDELAKREESRNGINVNELHEGIMLCLQNARTFLEEAQILTEKKHLRHSIGLIGLAVEEMGKAHHFVDVLEIAGMGEKPFLDVDVFRKHKVKLEYVPKPLVRESQKERRLRAHLKRFYSEAAILRERSFYVDFKAGRWQWGNPELEKRNIVSFIVKDLRVDCDYIQARLEGESALTEDRGIRTG